MKALSFLMVVIFATSSGARIIIKEGGNHGSLLMNYLNINKDRATEGMHNCPLNKYYESFNWFIRVC